MNARDLAWELLRMRSKPPLPHPLYLVKAPGVRGLKGRRPGCRASNSKPPSGVLIWIETSEGAESPDVSKGGSPFPEEAAPQVPWRRIIGSRCGGLGCD